jgi:polysaccharide biosynthesis transport protein
MHGVDELHLRQHLQVLKRRRLTILVVVTLVVVTALAWSLLQTAQYRSTAEVLLANSLTETIFAPDSADGRSTSVDRSRVQTEIEVMQSRSVRDAVAAELGYTPKVSIKGRGDTQVVAISATDKVPDRAAEEAQTYAEVFVQTRRETRVNELLEAVTQIQTQVDDLNRQITDAQAPVVALDAQIATTAPGDALDALRDQREDLASTINQQVVGLQSRLNAYNGQLDQLALASSITQTGGAQIVSEAVPGETPVNQRPVRTLALAVVLGLLIGIVLAFVRDRFDDRIKTREDLEPLLGDLPVLAVIPKVPGWRDEAKTQVISITHPNSLSSEAYRVLRTSLAFLALDRPVGIVHVTSANPAEGKSATIANLAISFTKLGRRVIVVDCDLRRPRVHQFFDIPNTVGLSDVLLGDAPLADAIRTVESQPRLAVVTAGAPSSNPSELLAFYRASEVLEALAAEADVVLLDGPPVLPVTDSLILARLADVTLLVARAGIATRRTVTSALDSLAQIDAPLVGVVLNDATDHDGGGGQGYYANAYAPSQPRRGFLGRRKTPEPQGESARDPVPSDSRAAVDLSPPVR